MRKTERIRVAAAILRRAGKFLICRRGPGGSCAHLWEFPGGKLEPGETPEACAVRECREELGIEIRVLSLYDTAVHDYPDRRVELTFFFAELEESSPEPRAFVHEELRWAAPGTLTGFSFCPADEALIARLDAEYKVV